MNEDLKHVATAINGQNPTLWDFLKAKGEYVFPTEDIQVYAKALSKMNLSDLQTHAMDKGIRPSSNRSQLETVLMKNFKEIMSTRRVNRINRKKTAEDTVNLENIRRKSLERAGFLRTMV